MAPLENFEYFHSNARIKNQDLRYQKAGRIIVIPYLGLKQLYFIEVIIHYNNKHITLMSIFYGVTVRHISSSSSGSLLLFVSVDTFYSLATTITRSRAQHSQRLYDWQKRSPCFSLQLLCTHISKYTHHCFFLFLQFLLCDALQCKVRYWDCMLSVRLSVRLPVRDVGESRPHRLEILETNCTDN